MTRSTAQILLIITQTIALLSLAIWALLAPFSLVAFKSPEGYRSVNAWLFAFGIWLYPLLPIIGSLTAWARWRVGAFRKAVLISSLPLTVIVPFVIYGILVRK